MPKDLGSLVRLWRTQIGMIQDTLARQVGVTRTLIARLEAGDGACSLATLADIAKVMRLTIKERRLLIETAGFPLDGRRTG